MVRISSSRAQEIAQIANKCTTEDYKTLSKQAQETIKSIDGPIFRLKESLGLGTPGAITFLPTSAEFQEKCVTLHCAEDVKRLADQALQDLESGHTITPEEIKEWFDDSTTQAAWGGFYMGMFPIARGGRLMELQKKLVDTIDKINNGEE